MTYTFKKLFFSILLFIAVDSYAQTHTFKAGWCRYAKPMKGDVKGEVAAFQCKLCDKEKAKEEEAKKVEDKKRADLAEANYKAKKAADKIIADKKKAEDLKNAHSGEVLINGTKNATISATKVKKAEPSKLVNHYFYSKDEGLHNIRDMYNAYNGRNNNGFIVNGETLFTKNEYRKCVGINTFQNTDSENRLKFPPNIGIVFLNEDKTITLSNSKKSFDKQLPISDLIDAKGNRIINDDAVTAIIHFVGDYFLLFKGNGFFGNGYCDFEDVAIYNYKTKKSHVLHKEANYNTVRSSIAINKNDATYRVNDENKFKQKGDYQAYFLTEIVYGKKYVVYYITNDGKIEEQEISQ